MNLHKLFLCGLVGLVLGATWATWGPRRYQGHVTLYFPSVQPELYMNLTRALGANPRQSLDSTSLASPAADSSGLAKIIFESDAAAEHVLGGSGRESRLASFRRRLTVEAIEPSSLDIRVEAGSGNAARQEVQALLDYYVDFTEKNPLSRVKKSRELVEKRLEKQGKYLLLLEEKLSRSPSAELRRLGDASLKQNPRVLKQLWMKRVEEEGRGRELLNKMQHLRQTSGSKENPPDPWLKEWAQGRKSQPKPNPDLMGLPVRRQELQARARLEREYYDALLRFKSMTLQHSFLLTWEGLEDPGYQIVDPLSVRSVRANLGYSCAAGLLGGLLVGILFSFAPRRRGS